MTNIDQLENEFIKFENQFNDLIRQGNLIIKLAKDTECEQEAKRMEMYLINRLKAYREGREGFNFDHMYSAIELSNE